MTIACFNIVDILPFFGTARWPSVLYFPSCYCWRRRTTSSRIASQRFLYKLTVNLEWFPTLSLVLSPAGGIVLYLLADIVMFLSAISIFNYGYLHYNEAHKIFLRRHRKSGRLSPPPTGCQGYFPHTIATASLVLFVGLRGAMVYDSVTVYRNFSHPIALASIVFDVSYMLIWISLWFCFTIKQEWSFKILAFTVHSSISVSEYFYHSE